MLVVVAASVVGEKDDVDAASLFSDAGKLAMRRKGERADMGRETATRGDMFGSLLSFGLVVLVLVATRYVSLPFTLVGCVRGYLFSARRLDYVRSIHLLVYDDKLLERKMLAKRRLQIVIHS